MFLAFPTFCPRCGAPNPTGYRFCSNCGTDFAAAPAPGTAPPPAAVVPPPPGYGPSPPPGYGYPPPGYYPPPARRANAGSMITETLRVFAGNPIEFIVPYLVFAAVTTGITLLLTALIFGVPDVTVSFGTPTNPATVDLNRLYAFLGLTAVTTLVSIIIGAILTASLTYFAVQRHRGVAVQLGDAFRQGLQRFLSIIGGALLIGLITLGLVTIPLGILLVGAATSNLGLLGLGLLVLLIAIPVLIYVVIALILYAPLVMMEGQTAVGSLKRSWALTKGRRLSLFAAVLVIGILAAIVSAFTAIATLSGNLIAEYVAAVIVAGIVGSWSVILAAVAYSLILSEPQMPYGVPPQAYPARTAPPPPPRAP